MAAASISARVGFLPFSIGGAAGDLQDRLIGRLCQPLSFE